MCFGVFLLFLFILLFITARVDLQGYIIYCPCMGRFGNQADHFLGSLAFAKSVNRTLILPHWLEYHEFEPTMVHFKEYFQVEEVAKYHSVVEMSTFMNKLAPTIWPKHQRYAFCHGPRPSFVDAAAAEGCNAKEGNPFKAFWDSVGVDFDAGSVYFQPLHYSSPAEEWNVRFPPEQYPVLAFIGAPAHFPVAPEHVPLHRFLRWSDRVESNVKDFIAAHHVEAPFLAIHLRNNVDFERACRSLVEERGVASLFSSGQCLGVGTHQQRRGRLTPAMCFPPLALILRTVVDTVRQLQQPQPSQQQSTIRTVVVATDYEPHRAALEAALRRGDATTPRIRVVSDAPHGDATTHVALLGRAHAAVLNCVSSYSAFAKRERDLRQLPTRFFGFPPATSPSTDRSVVREDL